MSCMNNLEDIAEACDAAGSLWEAEGEGSRGGSKTLLLLGRTQASRVHRRRFLEGATWRLPREVCGS